MKHAVQIDLDFRYHGLDWIDVRLPVGTESWPPHDGGPRTGFRGEREPSREEVRLSAGPEPWDWPEETICFLCDLHADPDAFLASLVATGNVEKTGPADENLSLTPAGRQARFIIGGDCLEKGPENLRLLRGIRRLIDTGARVDILAGNHDLRVLMGMVHAGQDEPLLAHLFARTGTKFVTLLREIHDQYLGGGSESAPCSDAHARELLFPEASWYERFPEAAAGLILEERIAHELPRVRQKVAALEQKFRRIGMRPARVLAAVEKCRELFLDPGGEFRWFFSTMRLARRAGAFLFIHAGVDDIMSAVIRRLGVEALNRRFRRLMRDDLFVLYHGPLGNTFRTKYRRIDFPFTRWGAADLRRAGIRAIVHGHKNVYRGQRIAIRHGVLNFMCDASVDARTRNAEGLKGSGAAATVIRPDGTLLGVSTDHRSIKVFDSAVLFRGAVTHRDGVAAA